MRVTTCSDLFWRARQRFQEPISSSDFGVFGRTMRKFCHTYYIRRSEQIGNSSAINWGWGKWITMPPTSQLIVVSTFHCPTQQSIFNFMQFTRSFDLSYKPFPFLVLPLKKSQLDAHFVSSSKGIMGWNHNPPSGLSRFAVWREKSALLLNSSP